MKLWAIAILCAFVFLVCFLVDLLLRKLFPKEKIEKRKQVVNLPRSQASLGFIMTCAHTEALFLHGEAPGAKLRAPDIRFSYKITFSVRFPA